jgi:RNA polymerase sigma factor (sigma-70 family)
METMEAQAMAMSIADDSIIERDREEGLEQDRQLSEVIERERARLRSFIRRRVPDREDAEDILQEVFYELIAAYRMMKPVERVGAWLFRVARNRITDLFRRRRPESLSSPIAPPWEDDGSLTLEDLLASPEPAPEAAFARSLLAGALEEALAELPQEQREVFIAHELEGRSFKELATETGASVNTLLARKHYAVLRLRRRLQPFYDDFEEQ